LVIISRAYGNNEISIKSFVTDIDNNIRFKIAYQQPLDSINCWLREISGIIITGGEDVHPGRYGKQNEIRKCKEFDEYRDMLELLLIKFAFENKVPLIGFCRGLTNVWIG